MNRQNVTIHPHSGRLGVDFTTDGESQTCLVEFGASFTLRLDAADVETLRQAFHDAARDLCIHRRDTSGVHAEDHFVNEGIKARELKKANSRATTWNPNDPSNW